MKELYIATAAALLLGGCAANYASNPPIGSIQRVSTTNVVACQWLDDIRKLNEGKASLTLYFEQKKCGVIYANESMRVADYADDGKYSKVQAIDRPGPDNYFWIGCVNRQCR